MGSPARRVGPEVKALDAVPELPRVQLPVGRKRTVELAARDLEFLSRAKDERLDLRVRLQGHPLLAVDELQARQQHPEAAEAQPGQQLPSVPVAEIYICIYIYIYIFYYIILL